jgi:hypothetical protein
VFGAWKVTLVNLALLPPLVLVSIMQMRAMGMGAQESQESVAESGKLATEAVMYVIALLYCTPCLECHSMGSVYCCA